MKRFRDPADCLAGYLARNLGYDDERRKVMAYGLGALFQMLILLSASAVFGMAAHCLPETMILFWGVGLLRRSTGGVHSSTYIGCIAISLVSICGLAAVCRYIVPQTAPTAVYVLAGFIPAFTVLAVMVWKKAPLSSPNKPIVRPEKIARLRLQCRFTISIYAIIAIGLLLTGRSHPRAIGAFSAMIAVAWWSALSLTDFAARVMKKVNRRLAPIDN